MLYLAGEKAEVQVVAAPAIEKRIFVIRERQVMLDEDLADLYGVETRVLVQQVKRNAKRFPPDFMFQLTNAETEALRSQIVISNDGRGGRRYSPYVFTEQGVAMLSGVLRSDRAIAVNIAIMRAFVELHRAAAGYAVLERRLDQLERDTSSKLGQHDEAGADWSGIYPERRVVPVDGPAPSITQTKLLALRLLLRDGEGVGAICRPCLCRRVDPAGYREHVFEARLGVLVEQRVRDGRRGCESAGCGACGR